MKENQTSPKEKRAKGVIGCSLMAALSLQLIERNADLGADHLLAYLTALALGASLLGFAMLSRQSRWRLLALLTTIVGAAFLFVSLAYLVVGPAESFEWIFLVVGAIFALFAFLFYRRYKHLTTISMGEESAPSE